MCVVLHGLWVRCTMLGLVSTLAGSGACGSQDGTGAGASFSYPAGVAVDASGAVWCEV